jgi:hypothetical protein
MPSRVGHAFLTGALATIVELLCSRTGRLETRVGQVGVPLLPRTLVGGIGTEAGFKSGLLSLRSKTGRRLSLIPP